MGRDVPLVVNATPRVCPDCERGDEIKSVLRDGGSLLYCLRCLRSYWRNGDFVRLDRRRRAL